MAKCKICKSDYEKKNMSHMVCGYECSIKYAQRSSDKKAKETKKVNNKAKKAFNESDKSILKRNAQMLCNKYSRLRDQHENGYRCVTCGHTEGQMDGGHFLPTSGYSAIRYNTNQIFQQCKRCNRFNGGMPKEYRVFMVSKYSEEYVIALEATKNVFRSYSVEYYQKLIKVVRKKIKIVEKKMV